MNRFGLSSSMPSVPIFPPMNISADDVARIYSEPETLHKCKESLEIAQQRIENALKQDDDTNDSKFSQLYSQYIISTASNIIYNSKSPCVMIHKLTFGEHVIAKCNEWLVTNHGIVIINDVKRTNISRPVSQYGRTALYNLVSNTFNFSDLIDLVKSEDWVRVNPVIDLMDTYKKYTDASHKLYEFNNNIEDVHDIIYTALELIDDETKSLDERSADLDDIKRDLDEREREFNLIDADDLIKREETVISFETELNKQQYELEQKCIDRNVELDEREDKLIDSQRAFDLQVKEFEIRQAAFDEKCKQTRSDIEAPYLRIQTTIDSTVEKLAFLTTRADALMNDLNDRITHYNHQSEQLDHDCAKLDVERLEFDNQKIAFEKLRAQLRSAL